MNGRRRFTSPGRLMKASRVDVFDPARRSTLGVFEPVLRPPIETTAPTGPIPALLFETCAEVPAKLFDILLRYSLTGTFGEKSASGAAANRLVAGQSVGVCVTSANSVPQRLKPH